MLPSDPARPPSSSNRRRALAKGTSIAISHLRVAKNKVVSFFHRLATDSVSKSFALLTLAVLAILCTFMTALILRFASPKSQIIVSAFEIFTTDQKAGTLSGKALADLLVDNLHQILDQASRFSGNTYSSRKTYDPVPDMPHIPVETSYGIEIKGMSVDNLLSAWRHLRYHEFIVTGDLLSGPDSKSVIKVRYFGIGRTNSFQEYLPQIDPGEVQGAVSRLALSLLEDINPEAAARFCMARVYDCQKCPEALQTAVNFGWNWTNKEPGNALSHFYLGLALRNTENPADALPVFKHAFELDNTLGLALSAQGGILAENGKLPEAESTLQHAMRIRPTPNVLMSLGTILVREGRYQEAEGYYRKALSQDSNYVGAYLNLGGLLLRTSKSADAEAAYRHARYLQPANTTALDGLVLSLLKERKADEALDECRRAQRMQPTADSPLIDEGIVYLKTGRLDLAIHQFETIFEDRTVPEAQIQLGIAYFKQHKPDRALNLFEGLLSTTPQNARIHYLIARILQAQGNIADSKTHDDAADSAFPGYRYVALDEL